MFVMFESLRKNVGDLFIRGDVIDRDHVVLRGLTDKMISNCDVLRTLILYEVQYDPNQNVVDA